MKLIKEKIIIIKQLCQLRTPIIINILDVAGMLLENVQRNAGKVFKFQLLKEISLSFPRVIQGIFDHQANNARIT